MEPISTIKRLDPSESDEDSEDKYYSKVPTVGDYKVPLQLIQRYMKGMWQLEISSVSFLI